MPWYDIFWAGNASPEVSVYTNRNEIPYTYNLMGTPAEIYVGLVQSEDSAARDYVNNVFNAGRVARQQANAAICERIERDGKSVFGKRRVTPIRIIQQPVRPRA